MTSLKRLIPALFIKNGLIVRSENFKTHQFLGSIVAEASRYNEWDVDELIYVDISREKYYDYRRDDHNVRSFGSIEEIIQAISKVCFMPLTFGGGIRTLEDVDLRIRNGADKIIINTVAYTTPELISEIAVKYGSQCVVISADYLMLESQPTLVANFGQTITGLDVIKFVKQCEDLGAGEIMIHSVDRDGKATGYDIETINRVVEATNLPVIACGGAATEDDFMDVLELTEVTAAVAGNMFHFTERAYPRAKRALKQRGIHVR